MAKFRKIKQDKPILSQYTQADTGISKLTRNPSSKGPSHIY